MSEKLFHCNYYDGEIEVRNMHWALAVPLKNGTRILIRDRYNPDVWLSGIYEEKRWPNEEGTFHAGVHIKESFSGDTIWRSILLDDEVRLA